MYSAVPQVRTRLAPGGNASGMATGGKSALSDEEITESIQRGDASIDACLMARYSILTGTTWTDIETGTDYLVALAPVSQFSVSLGAYFATLRWRRGLDLGKDDPIRLEYDETMALLVAVRDGKASLNLPPVGSTDPTAQSGGDASVYNMYNGVLFDSERSLGPDRPLRTPWGRPW